jgi:L-fuculose-phosphate aldolase
MPSVEAGLHARVLAARPDCAASVHTHQPVASAYALLDMPLEVKEAGAVNLLGASVPRVGYAPSGTGWLARRVGKVFDATTHACFMRNHGVVCVGRDMGEATDRVAELEAACADFFRAGLAATELPAGAVKLIDATLGRIGDIGEKR